MNNPKVYDALGREINIDDKVIYCIDDSWAAGVVKSITNRKSQFGSHTIPFVNVAKVAFGRFNTDLKVGKSSIMFSDKLIVVSDFEFLGDKLKKTLDTMLMI